MPEITKVVPLAEALALLDTPEADAERTRRAEKWAAELWAQTAPGRRSIAADPLAKVLHDAGTLYDEAIRPHHLWGSLGSLHPNESEVRAAAEQAQRNVEALVVSQLKVHLRAADVREIYADPVRMAQEAAWNEYARGVQSVAWTQGTKESDFVRKFRRLVAARRDAEEYDDAAAVRAIDARLKRLTGLDYPVPASTNGASTNGTDKTPGGRRDSRTT